ncbi:MAG: UbiA family prenyltransferase [Bacteroidetes bacterium]|nr:UbiA family prenyltransferase [Bacteroidota bacterium]HET6244948.1 UbiA-like polyprenyltransferase [Bacteroidia bacterium]
MEIKNYLSLIKFSHTVFAIPFAIIGFLLAVSLTDNQFDIQLLFFVLLCMVFARNAAMAFNRYIDRDIDKLNPRTFNREIPSGAIKAPSALAFVILNCIFFISTTWFINEICFFLSPIALVVVLGYSLTKRFTFLCHIILGIGLSLAPIGSYIAVSGTFALLPLLFSFSVLFWVSGFDIIYALQDEEFDKINNLKSIPVLLGKKNALLLSSLFHFITFGFITTAGILGDFGTWYWIGSGLFSSLLIYQHSLVKPNDLSKINLAFFTTNGIAAVAFSIFVFLELYF